MKTFLEALAAYALLSVPTGLFVGACIKRGHQPVTPTTDQRQTRVEMAADVRAYYLGREDFDEWGREMAHKEEA